MAKCLLAVFDIDGTFYRDSLNIEIIERLDAAGLIPANRLGGLHQARQDWENRVGSYTKYICLLVSLMEDGLLDGIPDTDYRAISDEVVASFGNRVYVFPRELHRVLREAGYCTVALSGSPEYAVKRFAEKWGFTDTVATRFGLDERGCLISRAGNIDVPALRKGVEFERLCQLYDADPELTIAIGDTFGDGPMLALAAYPIAFNPDPELDKLAWEKEWVTVVKRKSTPFIFRGASRVAVESTLPMNMGARLRERLASCDIFPIP